MWTVPRAVPLLLHKPVPRAPPLAAKYSRRIQQLVGYDLVAGTFVGYVDGRNPRKLIEDLE